MQTRDEVSSLHSCLEFSQPLSSLYQAMQTRKTFSIAYILIYHFIIIIPELIIIIIAFIAYKIYFNLLTSFQLLLMLIPST